MYPKGSTHAELGRATLRAAAHSATERKSVVRLPAVRTHFLMTRRGALAWAMGGALLAWAMGGALWAVLGHKAPAWAPLAPHAVSLGAQLTHFAPFSRASFYTRRSRAVCVAWRSAARALRRRARTACGRRRPRLARCVRGLRGSARHGRWWLGWYRQHGREDALADIGIGYHREAEQG